MSEPFQAELLDLSDIAEEYDLERSELEELLARANVPVFASGGRKGVTLDSWRAFVADAIRTANAAASADGWGAYRKRQLAKYPATAKLLDELKAFFAQRAPDFQLEQNDWTNTIVMPGGLRAGLKPRSYGVYLYATRAGETQARRIERPEDFEAALSWLQALPKYTHGR
jgi:hypothetical protein